MATLKGPRGLFHEMVARFADRLAVHLEVPDANREAFRSTVISTFQLQIKQDLGADTLRVTGWSSMTPFERQDRRERIEQALRDGEAPKVIAGRELVSRRWVEKVAAEMPRQRTPTP